MSAADDAFRARYGPWALIAGGSVGLGGEFARQLAARGLNLILVARRTEPLEECAKGLRAEYPVEVRTVALDLGSPDLLPALSGALAGIDIGLLVYNAAVSPVGRFLEQALAEKLHALDVNCRAPIVLAHELGRAMAARRRGGIILVSSLAGLQGSALIATYAATKAYDLVLGEGLWDELREDGVDVLAFCAGATRTPNYEASRQRRTSRFAPAVMEAEPVVSEALAALGKQPSGIAGRGNRLASFIMTRLMPRRFAVETMGRTTRAMYASKP
jgi:short-subunit dehydrogenase